MNHNFKSFGSLRVIFGLLSLALLAQTTFSETRFSKDFWVSTSTNTANLGTLDNPYDGSTQPNFDAVLSNLPPNSTLHILAGTYQTLGNNETHGYHLKSGQKILGSGIDVTIIQLAPGTIRENSDTCILSTDGAGSACNYIEVCDLTCDCNYTPGTKETYHGINLNGIQNAVRRVKVIHQATYNTNHGEAFGIGLGGNYLCPDSTGNIIEECEVSQFEGGGGVTAMQICCGSGIMRNNRVFLSPTVNLFAFNNAWSHDLLIEGNYVDGACVGVYGDTGGSTNLIIAHNTFNNCKIGVEFENGNVRQNITIAYNNIELADGSNSCGIVLNAWGPTNMLSICCTNISIIGNNFTLRDQGTRTTYMLSISYASGLVCANNRIDASLTSNYFYHSTNLNIYNNYDLNGNFLTNLNQVASPNGMTRTTVTYSGTGIYTNYATYADKYIGIKGFSTNAQSQEVDIILPPAAGHSGKDFVVMDETGLADGATKIINIKPAPASPDQINGGLSIGITAPYTAKTAITDGVKWFAK